MIGKGAQYLTAAGFGRYRITAASLGRNLMFLDWLLYATKQAIMDAFGVDGPAVIRATNDYLNGIAASDRAKATALAGFINEDPMMVCSLGLEPQGVTMPVRWLVGDGNSWIDLGIKGTTNDVAKLCFKLRSLDQQAIFGSRTSATSNAFGIAKDNNPQMLADFGDYQVTRLAYANPAIGVVYDAIISKSLRQINTTRGTAVYSGTVETPTNLYMFYAGPNYFTTNKSTCECRFCDIEGKVNLIPFKSATREGMVDLVNATFHPNQGTGHFTDAYTLQDGVTPWTPQTP